MMHTMAVPPKSLGEQSEVILPGARSPDTGEPVDEGERFLEVLQQLLITGPLAQAVQQPTPVETDAPVDLQSATVETEAAAPDASAGTPAFPRTGQSSLPSFAPLEVPSGPEPLPGAGRVAQSTASDVEKEARMGEPERKVAMAQPSVTAAILDLLDGVEPVRMADVPVVTREQIDAGRPMPEMSPRDMTRTAVAEGMRADEWQKTGNPKRAGVPALREPQEEMQENVPSEMKEKEAVQTKTVAPVGTVVTEGEVRDNQTGQLPFPHGQTGTASERSDGVRVTEGGARVPEFFQTLPPDTARDVMNQVVKGLALKVHGEHSEVRIRLDPESLGEVVVSMRMENGKLQAQIDVWQAGVKGVLESNLGQLRESLSTRGIEVQRLDVVFNGGSGAHGSEGGQGERQRWHGSRQALAAEAVGQYQTGRLLGYNTMEMVM